VDEQQLIDALGQLVTTGRALEPHARQRVRPHPPITERAVTERAAQYGVQLPVLLRRIYTEVANGGIGPGWGLLGLDEPDEPIWDTDQHLAVVREILARRPKRRFPPLDAVLFPVCDDGAILLLLDCVRPSESLVRLETLRPATFTPYGRSLHGWLESFASAQLSATEAEPVAAPDPAT
jgi:hypothetical protein